jgi:SAM-dependent methyltransferase
MDFGAPSSVETLAAYERHAAQYIERTATTRSPLVDDLIGLTAAGEHVLELGSGPGRDAVALEEAGLLVDRTDGASSFVERLRAEGHSARVMNVYADDFDGPYDAIFANAVLLHVQRSRLTGVLQVARNATRSGGVLVASFKKGDGEGWSDAKLDARRHFTYWGEGPLREALIATGWTPILVADTTQPTSSERWITVIARNEPPGH